MKLLADPRIEHRGETRNKFKKCKGVVEDLARKARIKTPKLTVVGSDVPNLWCDPFFTRTSMISSEALYRLNDD